MSLVAGLVVILQEDHGILALDQVQVLAEQVVPLPGGLAQAVDGVAVGRCSLRLRIDMDGDEQVRAQVVGDVRPAAQGDELVVGAREDGLDVGKGLPYLPGKALGDVQGDALLLGFLVRADAARIVAAVAGVDDDGGKFQPVLSGRRLRHNACCKEGGQNGQDGTYGAFHGRVVLN